MTTSNRAQPFEPWQSTLCANDLIQGIKIVPVLLYYCYTIVLKADKISTHTRYPTLKIYSELIDGEILATIAPTLCPSEDDLQKKQCIDSIVFSAKSIFHRCGAPLQHFLLSKE